MVLCVNGFRLEARGKVCGSPRDLSVFCILLLVSILIYGIAGCTSSNHYCGCENTYFVNGRVDKSHFLRRSHNLVHTTTKYCIIVFVYVCTSVFLFLHKYYHSTLLHLTYCDEDIFLINFFINIREKITVKSHGLF